MHSILITGANGFIGQALVHRLRNERYIIKRAFRCSTSRSTLSNCRDFVVGDINGDTDWSQILDGVDTVLHLAARTHITRERIRDPLPLYCAINVAGTRQLATQAAKAGVKRFIFVSSVKVNGERTYGRAFSEYDPPAPEDAYGISKKQAEDVLVSSLLGSKTEYVIVRPPLVHGPGVRANLKSLTWAVIKGLPLPFNSIRNLRSLVGVENLVDFLVCCINHPNAAEKVFLVSDGEDVSTPELVRRIANVANKKAWVFSCPTSLLLAIARLVRRDAMIEKLVGSLQVDISRARRELDWKPLKTLNEGLYDMVSNMSSDPSEAKDGRWYK